MSAVKRYPGILTLLIGVVLASSASAIDKTAGQKVPQSKNKVSRLTTDECIGLGGKVDFWVACGTQSACWTADSDGVVRRICIDEVKH
jgi:hypothetical protein